jgi:MoaA/NifB/PqqE/SkfB family radical SAM enzyme
MTPLARSSRAPAPRLPLVTLYLTDRCNSRCVTCDYWRHGRDNVTRATVARWLPGLQTLGTSVALLSGGEPLLNPEWRDIAALLRAADIRLWLLTSGLSLAKHAAPVAALFDAVTVSLDGTTPATYRAIRGLDAFDAVCDGIRAAVAAGITVGLRVTLQSANYRELPEFVALARALGVRQVSFLAVDVGNAHAFARRTDSVLPVALARDDLPVFAALLGSLERDRASDFASGFIAESPAKMRRLHDYFAALLGQGDFPPVRCNAPEFSAVVGVDGRVSPCFFIAGPDDALAGEDLHDAVDAPGLETLRGDIRAGRRPECRRCVCSLWRDTSTLVTADLLPGAGRA